MKYRVAAIGLAMALLSASSALAADLGVAAPAPSPPAKSVSPISGSLTLGTGYAAGDDNVGFSWRDYTLWGIARTNFWLSPVWSNQIDVSGGLSFEKLKFDGSGAGHSTYYEDGIGLHSAYRTSQFLLGGLISIGQDGNMDASGLENPYRDSDANVAVEGQIYARNLTLSGQLGYVRTFSGDDSGDHATYGVAVAQYFVHPNWSLSAGIGYDRDVSGFSGTTLQLGTEYKFGSSPLSVTAGYEYLSGSASGYREHENFVTVALTWHFNEGTLKQISQSGAGLGDFNPYFGLQ